MIIIQRPPRPVASSPMALASWLVDTLTAMLDALRGLITLDADVRATRTLVAERGVLFQQEAVTDAAPVRFATVIPSVVTENYTTALIAFDGASGAGRYRYDGQDPTTTEGMPIPAGGAVITLVGALNIRSFAVIGEAASTLTLSVTLHK